MLCLQPEVSVAEVMIEIIVIEPFTETVPLSLRRHIMDVVSEDYYSFLFESGSKRFRTQLRVPASNILY